MKLILLAALASLTAVPDRDARRTDEPPPPVECPMCGGNADLHRTRTIYMEDMRATALILTLASF